MSSRRASTHVDDERNRNNRPTIPPNRSERKGIGRGQDQVCTVKNPHARAPEGPSGSGTGLLPPSMKPDSDSNEDLVREIEVLCFRCPSGSGNSETLAPSLGAGKVLPVVRTDSLGLSEDFRRLVDLSELITARLSHSRLSVPHRRRCLICAVHLYLSLSPSTSNMDYLLTHVWIQIFSFLRAQHPRGTEDTENVDLRSVASCVLISAVAVKPHYDCGHTNVGAEGALKGQEEAPSMRLLPGTTAMVTAAATIGASSLSGHATPPGVLRSRREVLMAAAQSGALQWADPRIKEIFSALSVDDGLDNVAVTLNFFKLHGQLSEAHSFPTALRPKLPNGQLSIQQNLFSKVVFKTYVACAPGVQRAALLGRLFYLRHHAPAQRVPKFKSRPKTLLGPNPAQKSSGIQISRKKVPKSDDVLVAKFLSTSFIRASMPCTELGELEALISIACPRTSPPIFAMDPSKESIRFLEPQATRLAGQCFLQPAVLKSALLAPRGPIPIPRPERFPPSRKPLTRPGTGGYITINHAQSQALNYSRGSPDLQHEPTWPDEDVKRDGQRPFWYRPPPRLFFSGDAASVKSFDRPNVPIPPHPTTQEEAILPSNTVEPKQKEKSKKKKKKKKEEEPKQKQKLRSNSCNTTRDSVGQGSKRKPYPPLEQVDQGPTYGYLYPTFDVPRRNTKKETCLSYRDVLPLGGVLEKSSPSCKRKATSRSRSNEEAPRVVEENRNRASTPDGLGRGIREATGGVREERMEDLLDEDDTTWSLPETTQTDDTFPRPALTRSALDPIRKTLAGAARRRRRHRDEDERGRRDPPEACRGPLAAWQAVVRADKRKTERREKARKKSYLKQLVAHVTAAPQDEDDEGDEGGLVERRIERGWQGSKGNRFPLQEKRTEWTTARRRRSRYGSRSRSLLRWRKQSVPAAGHRLRPSPLSSPPHSPPPPAARAAHGKRKKTAGGGGSASKTKPQCPPQDKVRNPSKRPTKYVSFTIFWDAFDRKRDQLLAVQAQHGEHMNLYPRAF